MRTDLALAALASAAVPGMKPVAVAGIGPADDDRDSDLQSALVEDATGRRWVVRAPLTPVAGARLQRNDELVRQLPRHVPFKVPAAVGYAPLGKDGSAAVYPYVEGRPLDLRRLPPGPGLASAVGRAIAAIHNIPRALFEEQDVPAFDAGGVRQRAIAEVDRAAETGRVPTGLLARWEEAFEAAPLWQFATTPVHGAFRGASVVVAFTDEQDAATGRVVAVTDWDEAMVGDPAVDLAELWSQSSRQAWQAVLDSYALARAHRPDPYLHARTRLVSEMRSLRGLARAVAEDDEEAARRAVEVLRRVDRLTEADDSLVPATARHSGARQQPATGVSSPVDAAAAAATGAHAPDEATSGATPPDDLAQQATGQPDEGFADADLTMEVPPPAGPLDERADTPASEDAPDTGHGPAGSGETADDDATVQIELDPQDAPGRVDEPLAPEVDGGPGAAGEAEVDPFAAADDVDDPLLHDPVPHDAGPTPPESDTAPAELPPGPAEEAPQGTARHEDVPDDLEDEERLHELYGMPSPERDVDDR
jgi:macrolide phosphotransferase